MRSSRSGLRISVASRSDREPGLVTAVGRWVLGARPRTLGASGVAVVVGAVVAQGGSSSRFVLSLVVAVGLQVAVNYANDAADGARGVDSERVGPVRLVASGQASVRAVAIAAVVSASMAGIAGLALAIAVGPELLVLGALAMLAMVGYSVGPRPYAAYGLGELMVFVFFGPVAVIGTAYAMTERVSVEAIWASIPVGLLAVAIMLANNIRDISSDGGAGKRTLCVRLGDARSRSLFRCVLLLALLAVPVAVGTDGLPAPTLLSLAGWPLAATPWRESRTAQGSGWIRVLGSTAILHAQVGAGIAIGAWFA